MDFRKMRRKDIEVDAAEWLERMGEAAYSVIAFAQGDQGYPFALPCNLAYFDGALWLHGARTGLKYDALSNNNRVCVTTVFDSEICLDALTTYYTSLMIYGRAYVVPQERRAELSKQFGLFFDSAREAQYMQAYDRDAGVVQFIKIEIDHMTAKQKRSLAKRGTV